ncbi:MAG: hypothetical protein NVS1B11_36710 [Terriglobales bacterium]
MTAEQAETVFTDLRLLASRRIVKLFPWSSEQDDLIQRVLLIVWAAVESEHIRDLPHISHFMHGVLGHVMNQEIQRLGRSRRGTGLDRIHSKRIAADDAMIADERAANLQLDIAHLPGTYREMALRTLDDQAQADICNSMHLSEMQGRNLKHRTMQKLKACVH